MSDDANSFKTEEGEDEVPDISECLSIIPLSSAAECASVVRKYYHFNPLELLETTGTAEGSFLYTRSGFSRSL